MVEVVEADLHTHSTASDGADTPAQIVEKAAAIGLKAVGITDHDAVDGLAEALQRGKELGIEVVPGVEINTDYEGQEVHILGYYIDFQHPSLLATLEDMRRFRRQRIESMVGKLRALGLDIHIDEVKEVAGEAAMGRPHLARVMMEKGYVNSVTEAFERYIGLGRLAYVPRTHLTPFAAVEIVRKAGGIPVLAHPGLVGRDELIPRLISVGLMGLEVWHSDHTAEDANRYLALAEKLDLLVTGGSDYHGGEVKPDIPLGGWGVSYSRVLALKEAKRMIG
ncbi:MAG: 3,5-nucleoside bisphosphate phosphatase [Eubacteriales bacterium]|nr:3,5-nucleoside bisphosphate phosphatase [Eubacteriales bacterium]